MRALEVSLNAAKVFCCVVLLVAPPFTSGQDTATLGQDNAKDLKSLLQDAAYVFNRYEDLSANLRVQIDDWKVPPSFRTGTKEELDAISKNESNEKPRLYRLLKANKVSATSLFDVYSELIECATELQAQATNANEFGEDQNLAMDLAQVGARADLLSAKIGSILRLKILMQDAELASCSAARNLERKH